MPSYNQQAILLAKEGVTKGRGSLGVSVGTVVTTVSGLSLNSSAFRNHNRCGEEVDLPVLSAGVDLLGNRMTLLGGAA